MAVVSPQRLRNDIIRLSHRGLGVREFSLAAARALRRGVPHDGVCVLTMDPATLLPTGEVVENGLPPAAAQRLTEIEVGEPDFNKFTELACRSQPAASLSQATDQALDQSLRHRELKRPNGFDDELRGALVDDSGTWGAITLLREAGRPHFAPADANVLASLSPYLAEGMRRAILHTSLLAAGGDDPAVGLVVLGDDNSIESANPAGQSWLDELCADSRLPVVIRAVAGRARTVHVDDRGDDSIARALVRAPSGRWLLVRGSVLGDGSAARAAVILEPARSPELAPLIADSYGLTERERRVTQLVAQGWLTQEIAEELHLSPYTVQDHLKSIFEKVDVSSRGELVARLFFEHYAPRLTSEAPVGSDGWFEPPHEP
jgi:DNA-binding CsgD family transcriptional regulator